MKKSIIVKISVVILFMLSLVILFLGNYYKSVYSSCQADSLTIAKNINTVIVCKRFSHRKHKSFLMIFEVQRYEKYIFRYICRTQI